MGNMATSDGSEFEKWLCEKLLSVNPEVDTDVFVMYITGILDTDSPPEEKKESLSEILGEFLIIQEALDACDRNMSKNEVINPGANTTDEESHDPPVPTPSTVTSCTETTETCCTESVGLQATVVTYNDATQTPKYLVPVRHVGLQTDRFGSKTRSRTIGTQTDVTQITREDLLNDSMTTIGSLNDSFESDCWKPSMSDDDEDDGQVAVNEDDGDEDDDITPAKERKFLVFEEQLDILFERGCGNCGLRIPSLQKTVKGSGLFVNGTCKCGNVFSWSSQPTSGTMPLGNLLMAGAILFSGSSPSKALSVFRHMSIQAISERTFFLMQQLYLVPTIENVFAIKQEELLSEILSREAPVRLGGDGRCCSPGHTASFGTYSIMDLATDKILDVKLVQESENSNVCDEIIRKWDLINNSDSDTKNGSDVSDLATHLSEMLQRQEIQSVKPKATSQGDQASKQAILAQYGNISDGEEGDQEDPSGDHVASGGDPLLMKNDNAEMVNKIDKEKREKAKQEYEKKKEKDKQDREVQKQKQQERKDNEKKRTQKGERKR